MGGNQSLHQTGEIPSISSFSDSSCFQDSKGISNKAEDRRKLDKKVISQAHCTENDEDKNTGNNSESLNGEVDYSGASDARDEKVSFDVLGSLGRGSWGQVFLCRRKHNGNTNPSRVSEDGFYAVKVLLKASIATQNQMISKALVERQLQSMAGKHPFILELYSAFQSFEYLAFVCNFCLGGDLLQYISNFKKFPEDVTMFYVIEMILAIEHIHSLKIIHRDVKPENILLDSSGHLKLADFGLAKFPVNHPTEGAFSFCGTVEYMSPCIAAKKQHGFAVDWWQLGMLMFEMLSGKPCWYFPDLSTKMKLHNIKYAKVPRVSGTSETSQCFLQSLLHKNPKQRLGSSQKVCSHKWLQHVQWKDYLEKKVEVPIIPFHLQEDKIQDFYKNIGKMQSIGSIQSKSCNSHIVSNDTYYVSDFDF